MSSAKALVEIVVDSGVGPFASEWSITPPNASVSRPSR